MAEHRQVQCPRCGQKLRLTVSEKNFGREVEVTCSTCRAKFQTEISYPAGTREGFFRNMGERIMDKLDADDVRQLQPLLREFGEALNNALSDDPDLEGVVGKMRQAGYDPLILLEVTASFKKREDIGSRQPEIHEPVPLVQNDEVVPGAFTPEDDEWMSSLKIKFGD